MYLTIKYIYTIMYLTITVNIYYKMLDIRETCRQPPESTVARWSQGEPGEREKR